MLLALLLEFESHRGDISNFIGKNEKGSTAESAYGVGRRNSTRDEGRKCSSLLGIKMRGTNRSIVGRGEERLLFDPGSESRLGGGEKRRAKTINGGKHYPECCYSPS